MALVEAFLPNSKASLTVAAGAAAVSTALPPGETIEVQNAATGTVFFELGTAITAAVAATGTPVLQNGFRQFRRPPGVTHISIIAPSGTGSVYLTGGAGAIGSRLRSRGKGAGGPSGPVAIFDAPLITTLVPNRAGDPTFTFTRATTAYVADNEGILRNAVANEARFQGARRVRNWIAKPENLLDASWQKGTGTSVAQTATDPNGVANSAWVCTIGNAGGGLYTNLAIPGTTVASVWLRAQSGVSEVYLDFGGASPALLTLDTTWKRYSASRIGTLVDYFVLRTDYPSVKPTVTIEVWHPQGELVQGQSNTAPGDYVSVGVLSAPWHGAGVDGVKYFATTNANSGAATNFALQSQAFDNGTWSKNNATVGANQTAAPDATLTADLYYPTISGTNHYVFQGTTIPAGTATCSLYVKAAGKSWLYFLKPDGSGYSGWFNATTGLAGTTTSGFKATVQALPNGWFRYAITGPTSLNGTFYFGVSDADGSAAVTANGTDGLYIWGAQLETGGFASLYLPTTTAAVSTNVVTEAAGTAIPLATTVGYVAENQATNLMTQSQAFDLWNAEAATITANSQVAPDGSVTADTFTDNATNAKHDIYAGSIPLTVAPYTFSVYLKAGTLTWAQIALVDPSTPHWANFNIVAGTVGFVAAGVTTAIIALPNGWYRCSATFTTAATAGGAGVVSSINANTNAPQPAYVGTSQTMYLWGAQVESSSDPSSYVPTTTAATTRNTDQLQYPMVSNISGALATTYSETYLPTALAGRQQTPVTLDATGSFPQYYGGAKTLGLFMTSGGATSANARILGAVNKNASAWSGTTVSVCLNGGVVATGTFAAVANSGTVSLGSAYTNSLDGFIRNVRFYATRLTDVQIQQMTS